MIDRARGLGGWGETHSRHIDRTFGNLKVTDRASATFCSERFELPMARQPQRLVTG